MDDLPPDVPPTNGMQPADSGRRCLRAVLAADVANFGGLVSIDETHTLDTLMVTRRIAREELAAHHGWLFGMPGDGIFALFESAVDAVRCALGMLTRLTADPRLNSMRLRIGVHLGEVLFRDGIPFGETLVIAARLESLAEPGGILVSSAVMEAVAPRISAFFCERGVFSLKHSPRRVLTFSVSAAPSRGDPDEGSLRAGSLDRTMLSPPREQPAVAAGTPPARPEPPRAPALPKAVQLVVPTAPPARPAPPARAAPSALPVVEVRSAVAAPADPPPLADYVAELTQALTLHLGPIARILIKRHTNEVADPLHLVEALAAEIPTSAERLEFVNHARELLARQRR